MIKTGPFGVTVGDTALGYAVMSAVDPDHEYTRMYGSFPGPPHPHLHGLHDVQDLSDVRIGVYTEWIEDGPPEVAARCKDIIALLQRR